MTRPSIEIERPLGRHSLGQCFSARASQDPGRKLHVLDLDRPEAAGALREMAGAFGGVDEVLCPTVEEPGDGRLLLVRDWAEGQTLAEILAAGPPDDPLGLARRIVEALTNLHQNGLVHRNLHPDNLVIDPDRVVLLDPRPRALTGSIECFLPTRIPGGTGQGRLGTRLDFLAPEQRDGSGAGPESDVFATGVLLYRLLTGRMPIGRFASPSSLGVAGDWSALIERCLDPEPSRRPALEEFLTAGVTVSARPAPSAAADDAIPVLAPVAAPPAPAATRRPVAPRPPSMSSTPPFMILFLIFGGFLLVVGFLWLAAATWTHLPEAARPLILIGATLGFLASGTAFDRSGFRATGLTLAIIGALLLYVDAGYLLTEARVRTAGPWIAAMILIAAIDLGAELLFRSGTHGVFSAISWFVAGLILGFDSFFDTPTSAVLYLTFQGLFSAALFAGLTSLGIRGSLVHFLCLPLCLFLAYVTSMAQLFTKRGDTALAVIYPLLSCGILLGTWAAYRALPATRDRIAAAPIALALLALLAGPAVYPLIRYDEAGWLVLALALGAVAQVPSFFRGPWPSGTATMGAILGIVALILGPMFLPLVEWRSTSTLFGHQLVLMLVLGYGVGRKAIRPDAIAEAATIGAIVAAHLTLMSLSLAHDDSILHPGLSLMLSFLMMALAFHWRWKVPFLLSGAALGFNCLFQYFLKLSDVIPWFFLAICLGLTLVVAGVLLERHRKTWIEHLRKWN